MIIRIVSQSINTVFYEILESDFTESNFGFRKGMCQRQAIKYVQNMVKDGDVWCASIDLASFFDEIPYDLILKLIRKGRMRMKGWESRL